MFGWKSAGPIRHYLVINRLGDKGYEVVVSVVNASESPAHISDVAVTVEKDGKPFGVHRVAFPGLRSDQELVLGQHETAEGSFHLGPDHDHLHIRCSVEIRSGYGRNQECCRSSRRIATDRIPRWLRFC